MSQRIIRCPDVCERIGISRRTLYRLVEAGEFPSPIKLPARTRAVGWIEQEIDDFIAARGAARPGGSAA